MSIYKNRTIALLLAICMVLWLAACGKKNDTSNTDNSNISSGTTQEDSTQIPDDTNNTEDKQEETQDSTDDTEEIEENIEIDFVSESLSQVIADMQAKVLDDTTDYNWYTELYVSSNKSGKGDEVAKDLSKWFSWNGQSPYEVTTGRMSSYFLYDKETNGKEVKVGLPDEAAYNRVINTIEGSTVLDMATYSDMTGEYNNDYRFIQVDEMEIESPNTEIPKFDDTNIERLELEDGTVIYQSEEMTPEQIAVLTDNGEGWTGTLIVQHYPSTGLNMEVLGIRAELKYGSVEAKLRIEITTRTDNYSTVNNYIMYNKWSTENWDRPEEKS